MSTARDPDFDPRDDLDPSDCQQCNGRCQSLAAHFPWLKPSRRALDWRTTMGT